jgi:ribose/xylose/arabinose/galactoside ABC-type transport system permease subunit
MKAEVHRSPTPDGSGNTEISRESARTPGAHSAASFLSESSTFLVAVILFLVFGFTSANFLVPANLLNIIKQMSIVGILAIGMTMVILVGGIDLSVGSVVLTSGGVSAVLMYHLQLSPVAAIIVALAVGMAIGFLNGILIEVVQINPVIATLGTQIALRGLGQIIIDNTWVWVTDPLFVSIASNSIFFLPIMAFIMIVLYILAWMLLVKTRFGRYLYAIGGNATAAAFCAVPVVRTKVLVYMLSGFCAGVGGILTGAAIGVIGPPVGLGVEFSAIAAVVLGGASLAGGVGRVEKTLVGAVILAMVLNYMTLRGIPDIWQQTATGFLVLGAVLIDRTVRRTRLA